MTYSIENLDYNIYVVTNAYGRCFEGTLANCERYVKALDNSALMQISVNPLKTILAADA